MLSYGFFTEVSTFDFYSWSNEEGGRNQTKTTSKIYYEQVSNICFHFLAFDLLLSHFLFYRTVDLYNIWITFLSLSLID